jgi:hypothetical protein
MVAIMLQNGARPVAAALISLVRAAAQQFQFPVGKGTKGDVRLTDACLGFQFR